MAALDSDLPATQAMNPVPADLLATQAMAPVDADLLATQVKRPKTAYFLFQEEVRGEVAASLGAGAAAPKVAAALAARWKELDEGARARFAERARELKLQYDKDIAEGAVPAPTAKSKKAGKHVGAAARGRRRVLAKTLASLRRRAGPKKPKGSYSIWLTENRSEVLKRLVADGVADPSFEDVAKAAGKTWTTMTDKQKEPYVERARALSEKYKDINKACKEYKKAKVTDSKAKAVKKAAAKAKKAAASKKAKAAASKKAKAAAEKEKKGSSSEKKAAKKAKKQQEGSSSTAKEVAAGSPQPAKTPQKRAGGPAGPTPKKAKKAAAEATAYLDMAVVAEAEKAGFAGAFRKLAEREDMQKFPQRKLLDALVASGGLLHPAKDALLAQTA